MSTTIQRGVARQPTRTLTVVAVIALMLVSAAPAGATIVERNRYDLGFSDRYDDCGFDVAVEGAVSGHLRIRAGTGETDTAFFLRDTFSYTEIHTNLETGESLTIEGRGVFNEVRATHVEGNVFEFTSIEAGQPFVISDSAGDVVLRDRGVVYSRVLFDTGGDDVPGGEVLDVHTELRGPHPGADINVCNVITTLIGS